MNLSHVERYFSDFLSRMETMDIPFELDGYNQVLEYPQNLFIIGTVNIDDTTYMFSPKVLDRANVIEFKPNIDEITNLFIESKDESEIVAINDGSAQLFMKLTYKVREGKFDIILDALSSNKEKEGTKLYSMNDVKLLFTRVYKILEENDFEFAYRTVKEIRQYIVAAYMLVDNDINLSNIIDEQLLQKILPKIHGNKKDIANLLNELQVVCKEFELNLSSEKIKKMKDRLMKKQYVSFI